MSHRNNKTVMSDLIGTLKWYPMWVAFATHDIRTRFKRSVLGPFWITISMGVFVGTLALIFSRVFGTTLEDYLPYVVTGFLFWAFFSTVISEACGCFYETRSLIQNLPLPILVHFFRMLLRNLYILAANSVIFAIVWLVYIRAVNWDTLLIVPGLILFFGNTFWVALFFGVVATRYRDVTQIVASVLQIFFFATPIFWSPETMATRPAFIEANPLYHLIAVVRNPLLNQPTASLSYIVLSVTLILGMFFTYLLMRRTIKRIPFWL
ncbi:MAG: ABC transporter permease [Parvibaculaceae bacterium]